MKIKFKGKFDGNANSLPSREVEGAVQFREHINLKDLAITATITSLIIFAITLIPVIFISGWLSGRYESGFLFGLGSRFEKGMDVLFRSIWGGFCNYFVFLLALILASFIHEMLHAFCFKGEVELYTYLRRGLLFVTGTESMTKLRFIFMSMFPNLVLGFVPYILFFIFPTTMPILGLWGAIFISAGAGDYINVFNAIKQMPKGSKCFMSGEHTYWYKEA